MYESMREQSKNFHLFIFAFNDLSFKILQTLRLDFATIIPLDKFETPELIEVKKNRTIAEYCWTCTPSTLSYILKNYDIPQCTYVDADLYFYSDPSVLVSELEENNKSVLITEHRFSPLPKLYEEKRAGRFCVQFITFLREERSMLVLEQWRKQCLNWCYARYEDGKFGDQKYLDNWPLTYPNVHILQHQGGGIAPWNLTQYSFSEEANSITGTVIQSRSEFKVVFFHFQYVKLLKDGSFDIGWYYVSPSIRRLFYEPYLKKINDIEKRIHDLDVSYKTGITSFNTDNLKNATKTAFKRIFGYNILKFNENGTFDRS
jgi:hypothetical protein